MEMFQRAGGLLVREYGVHLVHSVAEHVRHHVGVGIHRERDLAMPEDLHDGSWRHALRDKERGARVSEVVKPLIGQSGGLECALKSVGDIVAVERGAGNQLCA